MKAALVVCCLFGMFQEEIAVPPKEDPNGGKNMGQLSYGRAKEQAKKTGKPQPVLYVFGDQHNPEVANWLSRVKALNQTLPHIVDVNALGEKEKAEIRASISEDTKEPFLQTVHATGFGYGPIWWPMKNLNPKHYKGWLERSQHPAVYTGGYQYYQYYYYPTRRFRRR